MPNKDKLIELRKKKAETKKKEAQQSRLDFLDAINSLHSLFDEHHVKDLKETDKLLNELKKLDTFKKELSEIKKAIKNIPKTEKVAISNLSEIDIKQEAIDLTQITNALQQLIRVVNEQSEFMVSNRDPEDFIPTRRVRKVRGKLLFDDEPLKVNVVGGGSRVVNNYSKEEANDVRFDPDETAPIYIGTHQTQNAPTTSTAWYISKFTRDGNGKATRIQRRKGTWDDRAVGW